MYTPTSQKTTTRAQESKLSCPFGQDINNNRNSVSETASGIEDFSASSRAQAVRTQKQGESHDLKANVPVHTDSGSIEKLFAQTCGISKRRVNKVSPGVYVMNAVQPDLTKVAMPQDPNLYKNNLKAFLSQKYNDSAYINFMGSMTTLPGYSLNFQAYLSDNLWTINLTDAKGNLITTTKHSRKDIARQEALRQSYLFFVDNVEKSIIEAKFKLAFGNASHAQVFVTATLMSRSIAYEYVHTDMIDVNSGGLRGYQMVTSFSENVPLSYLKAACDLIRSSSQPKIILIDSYVLGVVYSRTMALLMCHYQVDQSGRILLAGDVESNPGPRFIGLLLLFCLAYCSTRNPVDSTALLRAGIEPNPGPPMEDDFTADFVIPVEACITTGKRTNQWEAPLATIDIDDQGNVVQKLVTETEATEEPKKISWKEHLEDTAIVENLLAKTQLKFEENTPADDIRTLLENSRDTDVIRSCVDITLITVRQGFTIPVHNYFGRLIDALDEAIAQISPADQITQPERREVKKNFSKRTDDATRGYNNRHKKEAKAEQKDRSKEPSMSKDAANAISALQKQRQALAYCIDYITEEDHSVSPFLLELPSLTEDMYDASTIRGTITNLLRKDLSPTVAEQALDVILSLSPSESKLRAASPITKKILELFFTHGLTFKLDPNSWVCDLTQFGIEPNPGPVDVIATPEQYAQAATAVEFVTKLFVPAKPFNTDTLLRTQLTPNVTQVTNVTAESLKAHATTAIDLLAGTKAKSMYAIDSVIAQLYQIFNDTQTNLIVNTAMTTCSVIVPNEEHSSKVVLTSAIVALLLKFKDDVTQFVPRSTSVTLLGQEVHAVAAIAKRAEGLPFDMTVWGLKMNLLYLRANQRTATVATLGMTNMVYGPYGAVIPGGALDGAVQRRFNGIGGPANAGYILPVGNLNAPYSNAILTFTVWDSYISATTMLPDTDNIILLPVSFFVTSALTNYRTLCVLLSMLFDYPLWIDTFEANWTYGPTNTAGILFCMLNKACAVSITTGRTFHFVIPRQAGSIPGPNAIAAWNNMTPAIQGIANAQTSSPAGIVYNNVLTFIAPLAATFGHTVADLDLFRGMVDSTMFDLSKVIKDTFDLAVLSAVIIPPPEQASRQAGSMFPQPYLKAASGYYSGTPFLSENSNGQPANGVNYADQFSKRMLIPGSSSSAVAAILLGLTTQTEMPSTPLGPLYSRGRLVQAMLLRGAQLASVSAIALSAVPVANDFLNYIANDPTLANGDIYNGNCPNLCRLFSTWVTRTKAFPARRPWVNMWLRAHVNALGFLPQNMNFNGMALSAVDFLTSFPCLSPFNPVTGTYNLAAAISYDPSTMWSVCERVPINYAPISPSLLTAASALTNVARALKAELLVRTARAANWVYSSPRNKGDAFCLDITDISELSCPSSRLADFISLLVSRFSFGSLNMVDLSTFAFFAFDIGNVGNFDVLIAYTCDRNAAPADSIRAADTLNWLPKFASPFGNVLPGYALPIAWATGITIQVGTFVPLQTGMLDNGNYATAFGDTVLQQGNVMATNFDLQPGDTVIPVTSQKGNNNTEEVHLN